VSGFTTADVRVNCSKSPGFNERATTVSGGTVVTSICLKSLETH
jgi:hypothetical protein